MRILLSLLALSSCLLLTTAHGAGVVRIDAYMQVLEGETGRGGWGMPGRMHASGTTLRKVAGYITRRLSGAATRSSC